MEAVCFSEMSVNFYQTKRHHISGDRTFDSRRCENIRSRVVPRNLGVEAEVNNSLYVTFDSCNHFSNLCELRTAFIVCCSLRVSSYLSRIRGHSKWHFRISIAYPFYKYYVFGHYLSSYFV
jgi:hypothetical protein